jgi:hypothetical protein
MPLLVCSPACLGAQSPVITEFMAANNTGEKDEDGDFSDWIEIYNPDTQPVSLAGWFLGNNPQIPAAWRFPNVTVAGQGFLLVFASGKNRIDPKSKLHANFKLNSDGEYLALVKPDGVTIASEYYYPRQAGDVSYGKSTIAKTQQLVGSGDSGRILIPSNNQAALTWTMPEFDPSSWAPAAMGVGYNRVPADGSDPAEPPSLLGDITQPLDFISPTSGNSPDKEGVINAIDNNPNTKYLNFDKLNAGFTVTPSAGSSVVTGLRLTSANDAPERDPVTFQLSGSNDGQTFTEIAAGKIPDFTGRFVAVEVAFTNQTAYRFFKLLFPTVRDAASAVAVQIAEVELLGRTGPDQPTYSNLIQTDVDKSLFGRSASVYLRFPFQVQNLQTLDQLALRVRYDDGFIAYLNGLEVARANTPKTLAFDSMAVTNRYRSQAVQESSYNLAPFAGLLHEGANILAIQALRYRADSLSFLIQARLENTQVTLGENGYFPSPTPGRLNAIASIGMVEELVFDWARGFFETPIDIGISCPTEGTTIRYTTNGSVPSITNGMAYAGPIRVARTTTLRAAAFRDEWLPSRTATHTYVFLNDVVVQYRTNALAAGFPAAWNGQTADYGMDSRVVGANGLDKYGGKYAKSIKADLQSLPSISIVMDRDEMFGPQGLYGNPTSRGDAWEKQGSLEWIYPDNRAGFQQDAGIRIQGGAFRRFDLTLKKSFQIVFKAKYGAKSLRFPLFGAQAVDEFDNIILRANSNDAWPYDGGRAIYVRNTFAMQTALDMGIAASHSSFVHLYINGLYWGLYNPVERPDAAFSASYHGGDKNTWDAINQDSVPDGNDEAWKRMQALLDKGMADNVNFQRVQGNNPDGTRNPAYEDLIDVENLIDYMILNIYEGNGDWPGRNWWAGRDRNNGDGFHFYPWDTETALGITGIDANVTGVTNAVARPYAALRSNADFRMRFADRVYRHFFNGGAMYVNPTSAKWDALHPENNRPAARFAGLAEQISRAIVGESARWGDQLAASPYTRDEHWQKERDNLLTNFFPRRSAIVLEQLRQAGLYPRTEAPSMSQRGGAVAQGFKLTLSAVAGTIYYTTNGADPRTAGAGASIKYAGPVALNDLVTIKARVLNGQEWSALNEAAFVVGSPTLAITELHYNPSAPSVEEMAAGFTNSFDFEFIELFNAGAGTYDLDGVHFIDGVVFDFSGSAITKLAAGNFVLAVRNKAAFVRRYGAGLAVAGEYSGQLNNAGERIALANSQNEVILDFPYGSTPPWPAAANGTGPSLELLDPTADANVPVNWHASQIPGGTPGKPNTAPALELLSTGAQGGQFRFRFGNPGGRGYTVYTRDSLLTGDWQLFQGGIATTQDQWIEIGVDLLPAQATRYFRLSRP